MIEHMDPQNVAETIIRIEGLTRPVTLAHITDSHLCEADERDPQACEAARVRAESFASHSPTKESMRVVFRQTLQRCRSAKPDCFILTGDMVHFPTWANIDAMRAELAAAGVPYVYTPGNHDWQYPGTPWTDRTRQEYYPRLRQLACDDPAMQVREIGGVLLLAIDNSMYQVTSEQLALLRQQLATGKPCLLFMHIPVYIPSLMSDVMERWKAPIMMAANEGWTDQTREHWGVPGTDPSTQLFHDTITSGEADNLAGVFCGHIHIPHADAFRPGRYQYTPRPGYLGGHRMIHLLPA